jgi:hypothetical protein
MTDLDLIDLHVAALYRHDAAGRIVANNEPDGARAPRLYLGRTRAGNVWRFRDDLPPGLVAALDPILAAEPPAADLRRPPACLTTTVDLLAAHAAVGGVGFGPAWCFPETIDPPAGVVAVTPANPVPTGDLYDWLAAELGVRQPCFAVVRDGVAVSVCFSARLTESAAEAGVLTHEAYRGRGFAAAVTAAWAIAVRASGRIPLYSTSWDNLASQGVARRLGLILYGADCSIT